MADVLDHWRTTMPAVVEQLPSNVDELNAQIVAAAQPRRTVQHAGAEAGRNLAHIILGLGIGALVALHDVQRSVAWAARRRSTAVPSGSAKRSPRRVQPVAHFRDQHGPDWRLFSSRCQSPACICHWQRRWLPGVSRRPPPIVGNLISNSVIVVLSSAFHGRSRRCRSSSNVIHKLGNFLNAHSGAGPSACLGTADRDGCDGGRLRHAGLVAAPIYTRIDELLSRKLI
jgi:hypothetical protein